MKIKILKSWITCFLPILSTSLETIISIIGLKGAMIFLIQLPMDPMFFSAMQLDVDFINISKKSLVASAYTVSIIIQSFQFFKLKMFITVINSNLFFLCKIQLTEHAKTITVNSNIPKYFFILKKKTRFFIRLQEF